MASERANPKMAKEKSCCFIEGFLAYAINIDPKIDPIPAPDPATPAALAPAPMYLAAESMSCLTTLVCNCAFPLIPVGCTDTHETAGPLNRWAILRLATRGITADARVIEFIFFIPLRFLVDEQAKHKVSI